MTYETLRKTIGITGIIFLSSIAFWVFIIQPDSIKAKEICVFESPIEIWFNQNVSAGLKGGVVAYEPISCLWYQAKLEEGFSVVSSSNETSWCFVPCSRKGAVRLSEVL